MNCNPFTKGHLALITYAAKSCSLLHIFVVEENRSCFRLQTGSALSVKEPIIFQMSSTSIRPYMISNATFPTYFLKDCEDAAKIQSELDITLFASRIAPIFILQNVSPEKMPFDPANKTLTNEAMIGAPAHLFAQNTASPSSRSDRITTEGPDGKPESSVLPEFGNVESQA